MPIHKRPQFSDDQLKAIYVQSSNLQEFAKAAGITFPTAAKWVSKLNISPKRQQGYNRPELPITGLQCRHAREFIGFTRIDFCAESGVDKNTVKDFEFGYLTPRKSTVDKLVKFFDKYGIVFKEDGTFVQK
jgi:hypothetical protein